MDFKDLIKIVTSEPDLVIARFGLDLSYRTKSDLLDRLRDGLGYSSKNKLRKNHPYFSGCSLRDSLKLALSNLVEGNEDMGYRIKASEVDVLSKVNLGIHTVNKSGISLEHVFGGNLSAENVANILYSLRDGKIKRIQDICEETGIHVSVPGKHLALLSDLGVVNFLGYEPVKYSWNKKIESFQDVEAKIIGAIPHEASNYRIHRAIEVAKQLYDNRTRESDLTGVEQLISGRFSSGGHSRNITAGALRNLQRLGYVCVSNGFVFGDTFSQVSGLFDDNGCNPLIDFVLAIKDEKSIPTLDFDWKDARELIDIHDTYYVRRSTPDDRMEQIVSYLSGKGRATRKEISEAIKCGSFRYLEQLESRGRIVHESVKNRHHYTIPV